MHIFKTVAQGVQAMHDENVAHCDLKPENIPIEIDENQWPVGILTDLGISRILNQKQQLDVKEFSIVNIRGLSIVYASPEAIKAFRIIESRGPPVIKAGDIYSLNCILFRVLMKHAPWSN